jgi:uncharacterized membrane protein YeaQ/YmgE (transglycosylase-associated protein family)
LCREVAIVLQILGLDNFDSVFLLIVAIAVLIGGAVIGYLTDMIMGERGFGPFGNALLAILGAVLGVYARHTYFYRLYGDEIVITAVMAELFATMLLLCLGIAKRWTQG